jgi:FAD/FMN-containing dehydrogenase
MPSRGRSTIPLAEIKLMMLQCNTQVKQRIDPNNLLNPTLIIPPQRHPIRVIE